MTLLSRAVTASDVSQCTAGGGHGVAEDVGSSRGWENQKQVYRSQRPKKEQKEKME